MRVISSATPEFGSSRCVREPGMHTQRAQMTVEGSMAQKRKTYSNTKFSPEVIQAAFAAYNRAAPGDHRNWASWTRRVGLTRDEQWHLDTDDEFFAKYRDPIYSAEYGVGDFSVGFQDYSFKVETQVSVASPKVSDIESVFNIFEDRVEQSLVPAPRCAATGLHWSWPQRPVARLA